MLFPPFKKICIFPLRPSGRLFSEETHQYHEIPILIHMVTQQKRRNKEPFSFFLRRDFNKCRDKCLRKNRKPVNAKWCPADIDKLNSLRCLSQDNLENKHSERPFYWILFKWGIVANEKCIYDCRIPSPGFPASSKAPRKILILKFIGKRWARGSFIN